MRANFLEWFGKTNRGVGVPNELFEELLEPQAVLWRICERLLDVAIGIIIWRRSIVRSIGYAAGCWELLVKGL